MEMNNYKKYCVIGVIAAAVCLFVMNFGTVVAAAMGVLAAAAPLLLGIVIAYVLNILLKKIEKLYFPESRNARIVKSRRPVSILLSFFALGVIVFFIVKMVVPELMSSIRLIMDEIPQTVENIRLWAMENFKEMPEVQNSIANLDIDWKSTAKRAFEILIAGAGGIFTSVVSVITGVAGGFSKILIGTIFAIYLLSAKETLASQADNCMKAYLKPETRTKILYIVGTFHHAFTNFIVGQVMEAVIIGVLCTLGMTLLRLPYAAMTGTVVGVTALIPVIGAYIGAVVGAFMVFTVNPIQAVVFVIYLVILQQLEGNLIYPKVVGSSIGLPGLWVLAAVTVGGGIMGIGGMLIGVPFTAAIYKLLKDDVNARLEQAKKRREAENQPEKMVKKRTDGRG